MGRATRALLALAGAFTALLLTHYKILQLPFYWDELGQFVPAALDIYHRLAWVPYSTVPNVHPPGVMTYLASFWEIAGFSIFNTRLAMLLLAACALVAQWRLARILSGKSIPAWIAALFLFACPLFFAQAAMAQLDLPAMLLTTVALALFFENRFLLCALICCLAVMAKETAIVAPALFGFLTLRRRQIPTALLFILPLVPLCAWLILLKQTTGHLFGSPEFTDYNLWYPLHPVRLALALLRRTYYLFVSSGHIIGTVAFLIWLRRKREPLSNNWRIAFAFVAIHVVVITVLGGAVLERYLLPALPVLYAAFASAIDSLWPRVRRLVAIALTSCLLVACIVNPPYPFPMENNLAWTTFVALQQQASEYVEAVAPNGTIATTFPFAGGLRRPELGYVSRPLHVLEINDFRESNLSDKVRGHADALIFYSVMWDPLGLLKNPAWINLLKRFYGYVPQVASEDIPQLTGMIPAFHLCGAGQCVEVFRRRD
jgi:4-amino-4-deoxy-L-arabinose transferase-like glycosyltransferase